jgi:asparagine synthase (glutamine-hydrolysing)
MCGIAGIIGEGEPDARRDRMLEMLGMIRHRGPDQFGVYQGAAATLGSARLSIIDLSTGRQPISNEDGSLWIVFNGEIFNYVELRPELEARGHRFRTASDTEVLLHLFEEYGAGCLERLNGQFAFAIWDARARRLLLARDRLGIRPLYYTEADGRLLFASEVKALFAHPAARRELDPVSLRQVFTYWSTLAGRSAFRGVRELPPGHTLTYSGGRIEMRRYWRLEFPAEPGREEAEGEALERLKELLVDATLIRLRSDVPVGAYLSGGLDSSMIARIIRSRTVNELATFSIAFDDPQFDESGFQLRMARLLGTRHEVVRATHADIGRVFPEVVWHTETPMTRTAPAPMFLLSKLVRDSGFKVVMTGEGADEFLAGYDIFKEAAIRRFCLRRQESALRPLLFRRLYADIPGLRDTSPAFLAAFFLAGADAGSPYFSHTVRWRNTARALRFLSREAMSAAREGEGAMPEVPPEFCRWGPLERSQFLECTVFLSGYLLSSQGDRVGMAHSVESRLPYLDYRVVEFANRLPARLKLRGMKDKYLLRLLGREFLPAGVWQRPKRPYRAPIHKSFFGPAPDYVRELLSPERIRSAGYFEPAAVSRLVEKIASGARVSETDDMALAGILSTQLVQHAFVEHFPAARPVSAERDDVAFRG